MLAGKRLAPVEMPPGLEKGDTNIFIHKEELVLELSLVLIILKILAYNIFYFNFEIYLVAINDVVFRYADPSDPSLVLIYDQAGYIAGSQSGMLAVSIFL